MDAEAPRTKRFSSDGPRQYHGIEEKVGDNSVQFLIYLSILSLMIGGCTVITEALVYLGGCSSGINGCEVAALTDWLAGGELNLDVAPELFFLFASSLSCLAIDALRRKAAPEEQQDLTGGGMLQVKKVVADGRVMSWRVVVLRMAITIIYSISGFPLDIAGPSIHAGAASAQQVCFWLGLATPEVTYIHAVLGSAGALSAAFNTPIGSVIYVLEEMMLHLSPRFAAVISVVSVLSCLIARTALGGNLMYDVGDTLALSRSLWWLVGLSILAGIICGSLTCIFVWLSLKLGRFLRESAVKRFRPMIASVGCIAFGSFAFRFTGVRGVWGVGSEALEQAAAVDLNAAQYAVFGIAKMLAVSLAVACGGAGGVLSPSLIIGGFAGGCLGCIVNSIKIGIWNKSVDLEGINMSLEPCVVFGMSAMMTAWFRIPMTSILIVYELTGSYGLILPGIVANFIALMIVQVWSPGTIYDVLAAFEDIEEETSNTSENGEDTFNENLKSIRNSSKSVESLDDDAEARRKSKPKTQKAHDSAGQKVEPKLDREKLRRQDSLRSSLRRQNSRVSESPSFGAVSWSKIESTTPGADSSRCRTPSSAFSSSSKASRRGEPGAPLSEVPSRPRGSSSSSGSSSSCESGTDEDAGSPATPCVANSTSQAQHSSLSRPSTGPSTGSRGNSGRPAGSHLQRKKPAQPQPQVPLCLDELGVAPVSGECDREIKEMKEMHGRAADGRWLDEREWQRHGQHKKGVETRNPVERPPELKKEERGQQQQKRQRRQQQWQEEQHQQKPGEEQEEDIDRQENVQPQQQRRPKKDMHRRKEETQPLQKPCEQQEEEHAQPQQLHHSTSRPSKEELSREMRELQKKGVQRRKEEETQPLQKPCEQQAEEHAQSQQLHHSTRRPSKEELEQEISELQKKGVQRRKEEIQQQKPYEQQEEDHAQSQQLHHSTRRPSKEELEREMRELQKKGMQRRREEEIQQQKPYEPQGEENVESQLLRQSSRRSTQDELEREMRELQKKGMQRRTEEEMQQQKSHKQQEEEQEHVTKQTQELCHSTHRQSHGDLEREMRELQKKGMQRRKEEEMQRSRHQQHQEEQERHELLV